MGFCPAARSDPGKNKQVVLGKGRPLETLQPVVSDVFGPVRYSLDIDMSDPVDQELFHVLLDLEINIQRIKHPSPAVGYDDPMHMQPIVDRDITYSLLASLRDWKVGNKDPLWQERSPN